ncbi:MAG: hemerythrin family protein [Deltaproteobacteria bacterium]|nr:hemerythrin family protein [Candidatus Tharpella aukensis]
MNIQFVWKDSYSVGDSEIDEQHKGLFKLGNELPEVLGEQDVKPIIMQLFKYTREHFSAEEEMMNRIGFPYLAEHKILHDDLITNLSEVSSQELDTDAAIYGFKQFVKKWLLDHVLIEDNKYFQFSQSQK